MKTASGNIVRNGIADGKVKKGILDIVNDSLKEIGLDQGTYGNAMYKYIISHDTKGELLSAALEGDAQTMTEKSASLMAEFLAKKAANYNGAGNIVDLVVDAGKGDNWAEQAINLSKSIQKKVFPAIDVVEKFGSLVNACTDIWANDSMEDVYSKYKDLSDKNGNIPDNMWKLIYDANRGAWARYETKGMDENMIREKFQARVESESKTADKQKELEKLVEIWDKDNFFDPYAYYYPSSWTIEDRLRSLYEIRELMREMFTKDGKLMKGNFTLSDEEMLELLMTEWLSAGVKDRDHFYDYVEENGIVPKGTFQNLRKNPSNKDKKTETDDKKEQKAPVGEKGKSYWYLIDTVTTSDPSGISSGNEYYSDVYTASAGSHHHHCEFNYKKDHQKGDFNMSWTLPPSFVEADEQIPITITAQASGESDLLFSDYIQVNCTEYKGNDTWWNYESAWCDKNDDYRITITTNPEGFSNKCGKHAEMTVTGSMGGPSGEDEKKAIIFSSDGSITFFIYSYRPFDADLEKQAQALMDQANR